MSNLTSPLSISLCPLTWRNGRIPFSAPTATFSVGTWRALASLCEDRRVRLDAQAAPAALALEDQRIAQRRAVMRADIDEDPVAHSLKDGAVEEKILLDLTGIGDHGSLRRGKAIALGRRRDTRRRGPRSSLSGASHSHPRRPRGIVRAMPKTDIQPAPLGPGDHVFLVDGSSFVFRAYFQAINQDAKYNYRSDGLPTGALRLFCTKLYQFVREGAVGIMPTHLAIIFDKSEETFRKEIYPDYKGTRREMPDDLKPQFPLMREAVKAFGLEPVEQAGYEADDIIATYAKEARGRRRRGAHHLVRQGPDAARRRHVLVLRFRIRHARAARLPARAAHRPPGRHRLFRRAAGEGHRRAVAGRRHVRQRPRRARHRHQDGLAADRRIWRPRNAARPRRRDQAAEAPRAADRLMPTRRACRAGW